MAIKAQTDLKVTRKMKSTIFFLVLLAFSEAGRFKDFQECPYPETILPYCTCKELKPFAMMHCQHITIADDLLTAVNATKGYDVMSITIANSTLNYIPENMFEGTAFNKIRFSDSRILSLSDTDVAFKGLENHLEDLRATGENYVANWDWSQLKNLKRLDVIDIHNIEMHSVAQEFPALPSLMALGISKARLSYIHPNAFRRLQNLRLLILTENEISSMRRSMLPKPALKLYHIDLSKNHLASLPHNFFTDMPSLKEVILLNNQFATLEEETFSGIFNSLQLLHLDGNKIICDCRLRWLVKHRTPFYFDGRCHEPQELHNRGFEYLKNDDLKCK